MKHLVCYSGGHSSALVAIEVTRRYGKENVILLNHNISPKVEHEDIKRFKKEVADYLGTDITYANYSDYENMTPIDICLKHSAFDLKPGQSICTNRLKTEPFKKFLKDSFPVIAGDINEDVTVYYGFDKEETHRINRRVGIMASMGYKTDYPLALWERTIQNTEEIGIERPITYEIFKHANCIGCLKAGRQHWYAVWCMRSDIFEEALNAERQIGYSIINGVYLEELLPKFNAMKCRGIVPTELVKHQTFWAAVRKELKDDTQRPCDCSV